MANETLLDAKLLTLRALGYTGSIVDMERDWLLDNGATSTNISDARKEFLTDKGIVFSTLNDSWNEFLVKDGYTTGTILEKERQFWLDGAILA